MRRAERHTRAGFTLVEMIVTIVVLAIVAGMVAVFIRAPVAGYRDAVSRAELTDIADTVLRRMSRDVRVALPNSVRVLDGTTIEMLVTRTGGRYLSADDGIDGEPVLDFLHGGQRTFTVLGDMPAGKQQIVSGDRIVVFNLGPGFAPADAYSSGNMATVESVAGQVVTLATNPFATQDPPLPSPSSRFHVVREAVRYTCMPGAGGTGRLLRQSGYGINQDIATPLTGGISALAANNVAGCSFSYLTLGTTRSSLVILSVTLQKPGSDDGPLTLTHQVHVDNTP
ncbi:MAG TPA: prepilin-type N-terminal cleavage/methylation domain-containing protein [Telluria sp.]